MIEDCIIKKDTEENKKKKNYHRGKKVVKKKDLIIQKQIEKKQKEKYQDDCKKLDFIFLKMDDKNPFENLTTLKTKEGEIDFLVRLLEHFWETKDKSMDYIFMLYFNLKDIVVNNNIITKVKTLLDEYDYKLFMMKKMGHMLPPLDYWKQSDKKFEEWQIKTISCVNKNESVIVKAPTSSGKSFIAMSVGIFHKKILYVCPAKPVVYQVGANFMKMGYKVHFLVDNHSHHSYDSKTNIFIGTPEEIENNIFTIGNDFDYAVFDEIHNLNKEDDGDIYENIIKLIDCHFLALSATIQNIDFLKKTFEKINPGKKINYIEYNKRFINQQRWRWNGSFHKIHPFAAYSSIHEMDLESSLSFTPSDCATLWECIEGVFEDIVEEIDEFSPDEYFQEEKLLTLDDCRVYELFLKEKLIELSKTNPKEVQNVFDNFTSDERGLKDPDMVQFIKTSKKEDLFPMLMFHTNEEECKNIFTMVYESLDRQELDEYPFHYDILEKKNSFYETYSDQRKTYQANIKIPQSTSPTYFIKDKMEQYDRREKDNYTVRITEYYHSKLNEIQKNEGVSEKRKEKQTNNLKREMNEFLLNPDFCHQDVFQKHKDFIFTRSNKPMDADTIRNVRREIKKTLGIKIPYESPLFQMLKRGIGLYIDNMPDEYNWILQKLLANKEIGVVISDKTLCLGIDLPVRSSCFLGINNNHFTKDEYLQMAGRAGRRGKDTQGNVIFYGDIDYLTIMKGELPKIVGNSKPIYNLYHAYPHSKNVFENMIHEERKIIAIDDMILTEKNRRLIWCMRVYPKSFNFVNNLNRLEKKIYQLNEHDREEYLITLISEILQYDILGKYKSKKITSYEDVNHCKDYMNIIMNIHNLLNYHQYMITMNVMKSIFTSFNRMIYNYII
jgi:superfamily II DNA or RNA helicase